jgi:hypothetical protein
MSAPADTKSQTKSEPRIAAKLTTPFATAEKTEDRFYCRSCAITDHADIIGPSEEITCAWCDSPELVHESIRRAELVRERDAAFVQADRIAELKSRAELAERRLAELTTTLQLIGTAAAEAVRVRS